MSEESEERGNQYPDGSQPMDLSHLEWRTGIPQGMLIIDAIVLMKTLDETGDPAMFIRHTKNFNQFEALGYLTAAQHTTLTDINSGFERDGDDEDDEEPGAR